ncbi:hypothetical protein J1614_008855 [Plenodomus biglobosus]|nr:hypothetical protein J1614_008855 [Plenodomus biglobosus]
MAVTHGHQTGQAQSKLPAPAPAPAPASAPAPTPAPAAGNHNLDTLQSMLNLIFIQSGRFLKEHQAGGGTGRMKLGMQRTVPIATERFHDALDELESEVRLAQTVLRRDLALMKEARKKKDAAAKQFEAERARLATEAKNAPAQTLEPPVKVEKVSTPAEPEPVAEKTPEPVAKVDEPEPEPTSLKRQVETVPPPIKTTVDTPPRDPLFDGTPTTANPQDTEFDFDAIFGDAMDTTGDGNQDDIMDTSANMDFNLEDSNEGPSLLRGLEDFAKDSDDDNAAQGNSMDVDFTMPDSMPNGLPDLPDLSAPETVAKPETAPAPEPASAPKADESKPVTAPTSQPKVEETKDDMQDDMMATMTTDNLDDLFNMDEYENPENSSFDDAFFNFGD